MATPIPRNRARFSLAEIVMCTGGVLVRGAPETIVEGVSTDTRALGEGELFVALRGESHDAHRFLDRAGSAGALLIAADHPEIPNAPTVVVDDPLAALGALARYHRLRWARDGGGPRVVIGITGSAGKTTTKELCAAALAGVLGDDAVSATRGNLNNRIGVPMTLFGLEVRHRVAVVEMGTSVRGEIAALAEIGRPDVGLLVSVGLAHAEGLASAPRKPGEPSWVGRARGREAVAWEKSAILAVAEAHAIANLDDVWARAALARAGDRVRVSGFGRDPSARHRIVEIGYEDRGTRLVLERPGVAKIAVTIPLLGEVVAVDAAGAIAAADAALAILGQPPIDETVANETFARRIRAVPGRLAQRRRRDGALVLDDTYNASPAAFFAAIDVARAVADRSGRRLLVVAGEMRELGVLANDAHDEVGAAIASARPARLISLGGHADRYAAAAERAGIPTDRATDAADAVRFAARVEAGDLVLVKASRGVAAEAVVDAILAHGGEITDGSASGGPH
jgi:UDP-N-acetylmuramoyl-tripeptide--D-alanyl-D-alanine ligase